MRTSAILWIIVILVLAGGAWYYYSTQIAAPTTTAVDTTIEPGPSGAAGINGSANQGNLGQPDTGAVQQPGADGAEGSIIGSNLALGTSVSTTLGTYLTAYNGMTLYTYGGDKGSVSSCYDTCAVNWPPYIVDPEDNLNNVKAGVTGKVGTTIRTDGKIQVTYNGHPLYFYIDDKASGDTNGELANHAAWNVVKP